MKLKLHTVSGKKRLYIIAAIAILSLGTFAVILLKQPTDVVRKENLCVKNAEATAVHLTAATPNLTEIKKHVDEILVIPEYDRDPVCLYIVTFYYIKAGYADEAKKSFELLSRDYDSEYLKENLSPGLYDQAALKSELDFIIQQSEKAKQSARGTDRSLQQQ